MTDLTKGIIEINGFTFTPQTCMDEVLEFYGDKVRTLELSTGPRVKFLGRYYITDNLYAYAFNFNNDGKLKRFSLCPEAPPSVIDHGHGEIAKAELSIAKQWLKRMIEDAPTTDCDEGISYHFDAVRISSFIRNDIHYGLVGGEIDLCFNSEV